MLSSAKLWGMGYDKAMATKNNVLHRQAKGLDNEEFDKMKKYDRRDLQEFQRRRDGI